MLIDPGGLRQLVTLQRATLNPDPRGGGQLVSSWSDAGTYHAKVETLAGREQYYASQVVATASDRVTMRQVCEVTTKDRLLFGSRVLNVNSVSRVDNRNEWYQLLCSEQPTP